MLNSKTSNFGRGIPEPKGAPRMIGYRIEREGLLNAELTYRYYAAVAHVALPYRWSVGRQFYSEGEKNGR